jgi:hypothetical protein
LGRGGGGSEAQRRVEEVGCGEGEE